MRVSLCSPPYSSMEIDPAMLVAMMAAFVVAVLFLSPKGKKEEKVSG